MKKHLKFPLALTGFLFITITLTFLGIWAQRSLVFARSSATADLQGNVLTVNFSIDSRDRDNFKSFADSLGGSDQWLNGIQLTLDSSTADVIRPYMPIHAKLAATAHQLKFSSQMGTIGLAGTQLETGLPDQNLHWSTGSGQISLDRQVSGQWKLQINDPSVILAEATKSAGFHEDSLTFNQFWPVAQKLDRINVIVGTHLIQGDVMTK